MTDFAANSRDSVPTVVFVEDLLQVTAVNI